LRRLRENRVILRIHRIQAESMHEALRHVVDRLIAAEELTASQMHAAVSAVMDGQAAEIDIASMLTALRCRGESVPALVGAARAMREHATPIPCRSTGLLDTLGTFNISTAAALVAAACGVKVAKHGNRSVTSQSGSADVLEALGVNLQLTPEQVGRCIDEVGVGFCFAPLLHGAMKYAAPVRKQLGFRTIFNLLGPLTNPAHAEYQLIGVPRLDLAEKLAQALCELGSRHALVVCGNDELDEVSLWGTTTVWEISTHNIAKHHWNCATYGLPQCRAADLRISGVVDSAAIIRQVFDGQQGAARDIIVVNAAAALLAAQRVHDLLTGIELASQVIATGKARQQVDQLAQFTQEFARAAT
jgi:anthranilate phosphoribosyltransferase